MSVPYHLDADETLERTVKHHPASLVPGFVASAGLLIAAIAVPFAGPVIATALGVAGLSAIALLIAFVLLVLSLLVATAAWFQYQRNYLVLTSKNLIIVQQFGLFSQRVAQVGLSNIEDVKAFKTGVGATLMGYGTIQVSTASDNESRFLFAPDAMKLADDILAAQGASQHRDAGRD